MKNKTFVYLVLFISLLLFNQCKKDYPDDIPKWVKEDIQKFKKVTPGCICYNYNWDGNPWLSIDEYTINNEKVYAIGEGCGTHGPYVWIYDYDGNFWSGCNGIAEQMDGGQVHCEAYIKLHRTSSRKIWSGTMY
jgi:hypothetical protein